MLVKGYIPKLSLGVSKHLLPLMQVRASLSRASNVEDSITMYLVYAYFCEVFVCFGSYLFVRARLFKTLSTSTQEGRPETVVEV